MRAKVLTMMLLRVLVGGCGGLLWEGGRWGCVVGMERCLIGAVSVREEMGGVGWIGWGIGEERRRGEKAHQDHAFMAETRGLTILMVLRPWTVPRKGSVGSAPLSSSVQSEVDGGSLFWACLQCVVTGGLMLRGCLVFLAVVPFVEELL